MARLGGGGRSSGGGGSERKLVRAGTYLMALTWFQRRTSREGGKPYLNIKLEIIGGRCKGEAFFTLMNLDFGRPGTVTRWQIWKDACGIEESDFELGGLDAQGHQDEELDAEGDDNIRRLFQRVPFAAEVRADNRGQYANNEIGQFVFRKNWVDTWHVWAEEYLAQQAARSQRSSRNPEDDAVDPDDAVPAGGDEYQDDGFEEPPARVPPHAVDDDDIPF